MKTKFTLIATLVASMFLMNCGGGDAKPKKSFAEEMAADSEEAEAEEASNAMENVGIGPITELVLPADIDLEMAKSGEAIFDKSCSACHKTTKKFIGPSPQGIYERRNPAWVMNMILNPEEMVEKDPIAKQLLAEYLSPMANQNLTEDEARSVVEFFRTLK
jgi:mono/diheme cytochrome c family protein